MRLVTGARVLFFFLLVVVTYLTLTPDPSQAKVGFDVADWIAKLLFHDPRLGDKVAHFSAYASLGLVAGAADIRVAGHRILTLAMLAGYGALLEGAQSFEIVRTPDFFDGLANFLGATTGFSAFLLARVAVTRARVAA